MSAVETEQMTAAETSVLSQQMTSVLSQCCSRLLAMTLLWSWSVDKGKVGKTAS